MKCLHLGATDYLLKGRLERLVPAVHRAIQEAETRRQRRQAEAAVRRERDRAQQYLDTAEVILVALDLDARITLINRKGCDVVGWTERELLGRDWASARATPCARRPRVDRARARGALHADL